MNSKTLSERSVQTRYDVGPFRFTQAIGAVEIERINLPWGYIDSKGMPNVYVKDYQGNVRAVYNQYTGQITQQTDYYPYGLPKAKSTKPEANPFKYIGKELTTDLSNPFYDFEARIQLPTLGLFNRPDPKAGDYTSLNTYTYCAGDPVNYTDPSGKIRIYITKDKTLIDRAKKQGYDINRIHIVGHGSTTHILNELTGDHIKTGRQLMDVIKTSESAKDLIAKPAAEIILHSCDTGKNGENGRTPLAQKLSAGIKNAIIKAPNGILSITKDGKESVITDSGEVTGQAGWRVFFRGEEVSYDKIEEIKTLLKQEYEQKQSQNRQTHKAERDH